MSVELSPWYWRSVPLQSRSGVDIFEALFLSHPIATLLESPHGKLPTPLAHNRYSICAGSPRSHDGQPRLWTPEIGNIFPFLEQLLEQTTHQATTEKIDPSLPFQGGWLGWLGYGAAWEVETLPILNEDPLPFPHAYWYEPDCFAILNHQSQTLWLAASEEQQLEELNQSLADDSIAQGLPMWGCHPQFNSPVNSKTMKRMWSKRRITLPKVIFFRPISPYGLNAKVRQPLGKSTNTFRPSIHRLLPVFGKHLGVD